MDNYYKILGIPFHATSEPIRTAYRSKMREFHPDLHPNWSDEVKAEKTLQCINVRLAYETLTNLKKKRLYDAKLRMVDEEFCQEGLKPQSPEEKANEHSRNAKWMDDVLREEHQAAERHAAEHQAAERRVAEHQAAARLNSALRDAEGEIKHMQGEVEYLLHRHGLSLSHPVATHMEELISWVREFYEEHEKDKDGVPRPLKRVLNWIDKQYRSGSNSQGKPNPRPRAPRTPATATPAVEPR